MNKDRVWYDNLKSKGFFSMSTGHVTDEDLERFRNKRREGEYYTQGAYFDLMASIREDPPYEFAHIVCSCKGSVSQKEHLHPGCGKIHRNCLYPCVKCGKIFLLLPRYNYKEPIPEMCRNISWTSYCTPCSKERLVTEKGKFEKYDWYPKEDEVTDPFLATEYLPREVPDLGDVLSALDTDIDFDFSL